MACWITALQGQVIIQEGPVSGVWEKTDSPFWIEGDVCIPADSALTIEPGVDVVFRGKYKMEVYGVLDASGAADDSIRFFPADTLEGWKGLALYSQVNAAQDSTRIQYAILENAVNTDGDGFGGALYIENSVRIAFRHNTVRYSAAEHGGAAYLKNSPLIIQYSEFYGNHAANRGGALYLLQSGASFFFTDVYSNTAFAGAAMYARISDVAMEDVHVEGNISQGGGGGIVLHEGSDFTVHNSRISDNLAHGSGGGVAILENSVSAFSYTEISGNSAIHDQFLAFGGGVFVTAFDNAITFTNCVFDGNQSDDEGGAVFTESGMDAINCLFSGNHTNGYVAQGGGGIYLGQNNAGIINCTFASNDSDLGADLYIYDASATIYNSIFWDPGRLQGNLIYLNGNNATAYFAVHYSNIQDGAGSVSGTGAYDVFFGEGMISLDPVFSQEPGSYELEEGSPCIDAGLLDSLSLLIPPLDLNKDPRVVNGMVDMGPYEYQDAVGIGCLVMQDRNVDVYPNPADDHVTILSTRNISFITIRSISGNVVLHRLTGGDKKVVLKPVDLAPGMYVVVAGFNGMEFQSCKLLIQ
ncbi:MAG: right-handed parallel beta-helix repeat-containing protein [Bacteroidales bacterium]